MKKEDIFAVLYVALCVCVVIFFPFGVKDGSLAWAGSDGGILSFGAVTKAHPFFMGFLKVAFLATFGEMVKNRGKTGSYKVSSIWLRFIVWGGYGMLFTVVFALFAKGIGALMGTPLWFSFEGNAFAHRVLFAFSASFWTNMVFAYPMMLSHEWFNSMIAGKTFVGGEKFLVSIDKHIWGSFIPKTIIFFWIPAHTITFMLPGNYRILMAAGLSVALGFILTFKKTKKA